MAISNSRINKYEMFFIWVLVIMAATLANPGMPLQTLCQQTNTTGDLEQIKSSEWVDGAGDCLNFGNTTEMNSPVSEQNIYSQNSTNVTSEDLFPTDFPTAAWKVTWRKYQFFVYGIFIPTVIPLGIIGNAITLSVLRKNVLSSVSTIYLVGVNIADLIYVLVAFPVAFRAYDVIWSTRIMASINAFRYCYISPLASIVKTAGVWVIICFTTERFVAIKWPLKAKEFSTKRRARIAVIGAYALGCALNGIRFFYRYPVRKVDSTTQEVYFDYAYTYISRSELVSAVVFYAYFIVVETVPFVLLACLNSVVIWCIRRAQRTRLTMAGDNSTTGDKGNHRENQITVLLICMVMAHLICNLAGGLTSIWIAINGRSALRTTKDRYLYYIITTSNGLLLSAPVINCILYVGCSSAMRAGIKSQLCFGRKSKDQPDQTKTSVVSQS